jgi:hypothetical protein
MAILLKLLKDKFGEELLLIVVNFLEEYWKVKLLLKYLEE